jgi:hypothetical protein
MNTDQDKKLRPDHDPLTEVFIGLVVKVAGGLGSEFLEKVDENALATCLFINFGTPRPMLKHLPR